MEYAQSKGMQVMALDAPYGYSNEVLHVNPNWAEGMRVVGARFRVDSDQSLHFINTLPGVSNGGFESGIDDWKARNWLGAGDRGVAADLRTKHSGNTSVVIKDSHGNARLHKSIKVTPWRQYHIRLWMKTDNYQGPLPAVELFDSSTTDAVRLYKNIEISANQDWAPFDLTFNSQESSALDLYFGVWGGTSGTIWFDDISIEETALVFLLRRSGAPLQVYDPASKAIFHETTDFDPIQDPLLTADPHDDYHAPPIVRLPANTTMKPGEIVAIDYYAAQPVLNHQLSLCLTEPDVQAWAAANSRAIVDTAPPQASFFLMYDEIRQMNSCFLCRSRHLTAGQLLADHVANTIATYHSLRPEGNIYVWSDMFDPFDNAVDHYYLAEGTLADSWKGLSSSTRIMNWNLRHLTKSLQWFSGTNAKQPVPHRQIIAGYYDNHDGRGAAASELHQALGVPGIDGLMYTSWLDDDSQMKAFAEAAKRAWPEYRASVMHR